MSCTGYQMVHHAVLCMNRHLDASINYGDMKTNAYSVEFI